MRYAGMAVTVLLGLACALFLAGLLLGLGARLTVALLARLDRWAKARLADTQGGGGQGALATYTWPTSVERSSNTARFN